MCIDQVSWLTFVLLTAPSRHALGMTVAILRLSSRSQSRGGGRLALPSLESMPDKSSNAGCMAFVFVLWGKQTPKRITCCKATCRARQ